MDPSCCCPFPPPRIKLVGCNLDSSLGYFSPRSKIKCRELCRPRCLCPKPGPIVIRPGDGAKWEYYQEHPEEAQASGYVPPYDFNRKIPCQCPPPLPCTGGFEIGREFHPVKDYIQANAVNVTRAIPRIPVPRIALTNYGDTTDWCKSGWALNHIFSQHYGRMPRYICGIKNTLGLEDYRLRYNLEEQGVVCPDEDHNVMNQMGLLELIHTKNPAVWKSQLFVKPKPIHGSAQPPYPRFLPF